MTHPHKLTLNETACEHGFDEITDMLQDFADESSIPACCSEGCLVEPDGKCEHGFKSIFLAAGLI